MLLDKIRIPLTQIHDKVYHYHATGRTAPPYICWAEDGTKDFLADGKHGEKGWTGTTDLFTKTENDPLIPLIEKGMERPGVAWYLNSVQYETETGLIHYEWIWEVT